MRRLFLIFSVLCGLSAMAHAETKPVLNKRSMPDPGQFNSEAVYIASCTCAEGNDIKISTHSSLVFGVNVTTVSAAGGKMAFYDSRSNGSPSTRMLSSTITTTSLLSWPFEVGASSGILVNSIGGACYTVYYLEYH